MENPNDKRASKPITIFPKVTHREYLRYSKVYEGKSYTETVMEALDLLMATKPQRGQNGAAYTGN